MAAALAWASIELRTRWRSTLVLIIMAGVGGSVMLAAAAGARRTDTAFARLLDRGDHSDVRLQYAAAEDIDGAALRRLNAHPDVEQAVPVYLTVAFGEQSEFDLVVISSPSASFLRDIDRPRIIEGRAPDPDQAGEVLAGQFSTESIGIEVGDTFSLSTFSAEQFDNEDFSAVPNGPELELTLVGIARTPEEISDREFVGLYGTPAFHETYREAAGGFGPVIEIATRKGVDDEAVVREALDGIEFDEIFIERSEVLLTTVTDATRVLSLGLIAFALCAALATFVACGQALARRLGALSPDLRALQTMGLTRGQGWLGALLTVMPVALGGAFLAVLGAWLASPLLPIGIARSAEPDPGLDFDVVVLGLGASFIAAVVLAAGALSAWRLTGSLRGDAHEPARIRRSVLAGAARRAARSPVAGFGVAMALEPGRGQTAVPVRPAITGAVLGIIGVVAALTFGASLDHLLETPSQYGWNWTLSPDLEDEDLPRLLAVPGVRDVGRLSYGLLVAGEDELTSVAVEAVAGSPSLTILRGRMPTRGDEIGVGTETADRHDLEIGDQVDIDDPAAGGARRLRVVGELLLPAEDDIPFNDGLVLTPAALEQLKQSDGFTQWVVTFDEGISAEQAERRLDEAMPGLISVYARPRPPGDVGNIGNVRGVPRALAAFLVLVALAAVGHAIATAVRRRRSDIAIMRALGVLRRHVFVIVAMQSLTLLCIGLLFGVPLGIAAGRIAWAWVADALGVAPSPVIPFAALALLVPAALLAGLALAALPARSAARIRAAEVLSTD